MPKYLLREDQIPRHWYNILADLDSPPAPVLHPQTRKPVGPQDLAPLFPMAIIEQEMSTRREVPIPDEVRGALALRQPQAEHRGGAGVLQRARTRVGLPLAVGTCRTRRRAARESAEVAANSQAMRTLPPSFGAKHGAVGRFIRDRTARRVQVSSAG